MVKLLTGQPVNVKVFVREFCTCSWHIRELSSEPHVVITCNADYTLAFGVVLSDGTLASR